MAVLILCAAAFVIGSIPFGLLIARAFKVTDLRSRGSGNIGATNVSRVLGFWPAGALTLLLDAAKGFVPVILLQLPRAPETWAALRLPPIESIDPATGGFGAVAVWAAAFAAVAGHCFSPWLRFNGGKGVATGLGAIAALSPVAALGGLIGYGFAFARTRIGSLSSLIGIAFAAGTYLIFFPVGVHSWFGAAIVALIVVRHEGNIDALLKNRERAFR